MGPASDGVVVQVTGPANSIRSTAPPLPQHVRRRDAEGYSEHLAGYTAHPAVNTIPYVVEADPGIVAIFGLPPVVARL